MLDEGSSAAEAIRRLCKTLHSRLEQNEDFRALLALERALAEVAGYQLPPARQLQTTIAQAFGSDYGSSERPLSPAKPAEART